MAESKFSRKPPSKTRMMQMWASLYGASFETYQREIVMLAEAREFLPLRFCEDIVEFSYEDAADPADVQVLMDLGGTAMVMIAVCSLYFSFYLYEFVRTGQRHWYVDQRQNRTASIAVIAVFVPCWGDCTCYPTPAMTFHPRFDIKGNLQTWGNVVLGVPHKQHPCYVLQLSLNFRESAPKTNFYCLKTSFI